MGYWSGLVDDLKLEIEGELAVVGGGVVGGVVGDGEVVVGENEEDFCLVDGKDIFENGSLQF
jgi:hypothetical protein